MSQSEFFVEVENKSFTFENCLDYGLWCVNRSIQSSYGITRCIDEPRCVAAGVDVYHHGDCSYIPTWAGALIFDMEHYWLKDQLGKCIKIVGWICQDPDRKSKYSTLVALIRGPALRVVSVPGFEIKLEGVREILQQDLEDCGYEL